ncbi:MAG: YitT family protein [Candidatus Limivivens sp.]|nr:YitT family protein [Candidatus Limivivens sp.]
MKWYSRKTYLDLLKEIPSDLGGAVLFNIGIYCFAMNADFATGGLSGVGLIFHHLWNVPMGWFTILLNIPLILISIRVLGKKFLISSIKTMVIYSLVLDYVMPFFPVYTGNPILASVCTGVFSGLGLVPVYYRGGSTGGMDFLVMTLQRLKPHLSIGQVTMAVDSIIILCGGWVFRNADAVILGMVTAYVTSVIVDRVLCGLGEGKVVLAVTCRKEEAALQIDQETLRGCTYLEARGSYKNEKRDVLMCACYSRQVVTVKRIIQELDPEAFIIVLNSNEVLGQGFKTFDGGVP